MKRISSVMTVNVINTQFVITKKIWGEPRPNMLEFYFRSHLIKSSLMSNFSFGGEIKRFF